MSSLKAISVPFLSFLWIGAMLTYPLWSDSLATPKQPVTQAPASSTVVQKTDAPTEAIDITGIPRHITVASVGVDIGISDGFYDMTNDVWSISEESAFFATVTTPLNTKAGNTFIYGHNSGKVFGKLLSLEAPSEAVVTTDNGYKFIYEYRNREAVNPTDTSVLNYEGTPRIMLQTCSGLWNEHREMFYFYLKSVEKIDA